MLGVTEITLTTHTGMARRHSTRHLEKTKQESWAIAKMTARCAYIWVP